MHSPQSVRLYLDSDGEFQCRAEESTQVDAYVRAMRVMQQRTGVAPRAALSNCAPIHVASLAGPLTVARVSGLPHLQDPARAPVALSDDEQAIFLRRGDHYLLRTYLNGEKHEAFVALSYDIAPKLIVSTKAVVQRNPLDAMIADINATKLLEIVQARELSPTEQFVASQTMPTIWRRLGGPPVAVITNPTSDDAEVCRDFSRLFSDPVGRLRQIGELSSNWGAALFGTTDLGYQEASSNKSDTAAPEPALLPLTDEFPSVPTPSIAPTASAPRMRV
jgi:hypothetical protein